MNFVFGVGKYVTLSSNYVETGGEGDKGLIKKFCQNKAIVS
jgi:hypothetical protein